MMSDVNVTNPTPEPTEEIKVTEATTDQDKVVKIGYTVGITEEGNFVFKLLGNKPEVIGLLGTHQYASRKIDRLFDSHQNSGDALIVEVGKILVGLDQKVNGLDQKVNTILSHRCNNS